MELKQILGRLLQICSSQLQNFLSLSVSHEKIGNRKLKNFKKTAKLTKIEWVVKEVQDSWVSLSSGHNCDKRDLYTCAERMRNSLVQKLSYGQIINFENSENRQNGLKSFIIR